MSPDVRNMVVRRNETVLGVTGNYQCFHDATCESEGYQVVVRVDPGYTLVDCLCSYKGKPGRTMLPRNSHLGEEAWVEEQYMCLSFITDKCRTLRRTRYMKDSQLHGNFIPSSVEQSSLETDNLAERRIMMAFAYLPGLS